MEVCSVVIVGAGPAGLTLALALAGHNIKSIVLEKELAVGDDPRGVVLAGDAVRILYQLGLEKDLKNIGHSIQFIDFHKSNFQNIPFHSVQIGRDLLEQSTSNGILQVQPRLVKALESKVKALPQCELRRGALVTSVAEVDDGVLINYTQSGDSAASQIQCSWLIGADGKTGIVRKHFLEPIANVRQEVGIYPYSGTWIAANLKIHLPTPETHPDFRLWDLGFTPEQIYDLFWPAGWHFCSPPGKPVACGRFGPIQDRLWRHEFAEHLWTDDMNAEDLFWENLMPMITRTDDENGVLFPQPVMFPKNCIEINRCRPFTFCQKVVNKWFHKRTILIGDAAHVFPPFGGLGIACGVRDAHSLAWRLAILSRVPNMTPQKSDSILHAWSLERRQGIDDAARTTMANGKLANDPETLGFFVFRNVTRMFSDYSWFLKLTSPLYSSDRNGYRSTVGGQFLPEFGDGMKLSQIYFRSGDDNPILSDKLLEHNCTAMSLLVIGKNHDECLRNLPRVQNFVFT